MTDLSPLSAEERARLRELCDRAHARKRPGFTLGDLDVMFVDLPRLLAQVAALEVERAKLLDRMQMACETPADDCDCAGCLYAAEVSDARDALETP